MKTIAISFLVFYALILGGQTVPSRARLPVGVRMPGATVASGGSGLPVLVSHAVGLGNPTGGGSATMTNTTGANWLIAGPVRNNGALTITDAVTSPSCPSPCNTWNALSVYNSAGVATQFFYAENAHVGSTHVVTCAGNSDACTIPVAAFSGMVTSGSFDAGTDSGTASGGAATLQPGSITPSSGHRLVIFGASVLASSATLTADSGFTQTDYQDFVAATAYGGGMLYLVQSNGTTVNPTATATGAVISSAVIAAFKGQ